MSKPIEYSYMTKDKLMTYTFIALLVIAVVSAALWSQETTPSGWNLGLSVGIIAFIAVGVAVGADALLYKLVSDSPLNTMSSAVFGLIVALSYSLGVPSMAQTTDMVPIALLSAPDAFVYVGLISLVGLVIFKKLQGMGGKGRKYFNPAAAAKFIVLLPFISSVFLAKDHFASYLSGGLSVPNLAGPIGNEIIGGNGLASFTSYLQGCYSLPTATSYVDLSQLMILQKFHGWIGGASSIAVIIVGLGLFIAARRYIKWRITVAYFVSVALMSLLMTGIYGGDPTVRLLFEIFIGSSIFLGFFMATDPATTPITYSGQIIFGIGLGILTVLIQTYMNFFGGSLLALLIMNLTSPKLDRIGILKVKAAEKEPKRPKGKLFANVKTTACIRCGACMRICCNRLSPILIKQAFDKKDAAQLLKLDADYCAGCGSCNFVCPARINLRGTMLTYPMADEDGEVIEQFYLKGTKDENLGVYSDLFAAKSLIEGQDGGVATAVLVSGIQKGLFDAALVCKRIDGYWSEAVIARSVDEIMSAKGTKYIRVHMMSKLAELVKEGRRKIAIVGTACQMRAARRIQQSILGEYPDLELTLIGLFCFEEFNYYQLKEQTKKLMNIDLDKAEKTQINKGKFIVTVDGKESSIMVKDLNEAVENGCLCCPDFTAVYSDISVGSVGSEDGYSTVIVRSEIGDKLLEKLDITKAEVNKEEVDKLAIRKKKRANQNAPECPT